MTKEELLKPRYKVIAGYPQSFWSIGLIIEAFPVDHAENAFGKYPHLFKKLEWWEEIKIEDMPEYVKFLRPYHTVKKGTVMKPTYKEGYFSDGGSHTFLYDEYIQPATEQEYLEYQKQTEPKMKLWR